MPALTRALMNKEVKNETEEIYKSFTRREVEVLEYICQGYTDKEIGEKCFISSRTAGGHRYNLLKKTKCKNSLGLIYFAIKHGFLKA
jgi:DNA-binding NarL/FixJ family response regulator